MDGKKKLFDNYKLCVFKKNNDDFNVFCHTQICQNKCFNEK